MVPQARMPVYCTQPLHEMIPRRNGALDIGAFIVKTFPATGCGGRTTSLELFHERRRSPHPRKAMDEDVPGGRVFSTGTDEGIAHTFIFSIKVCTKKEKALDIGQRAFCILVAGGGIEPPTLRL